MFRRTFADGFEFGHALRDALELRAAGNQSVFDGSPALLSGFGGEVSESFGATLLARKEAM